MDTVSNKTMNDETAIKKCKTGQHEAFRHLVERYQQQAASHATAILGNREDAKDAAQEAFIDAFRSIMTFDQSRPFYPWFYVLLRNRCYKMTARRREAENIDEVLIVAPSTGAQAGDAVALEQALLAIDKEDREILTLKYFDGLSYEELAERLEIPRGTVMSRLFHARRKLRLKIER